MDRKATAVRKWTTGLVVMLAILTKLGVPEAAEVGSYTYSLGAQYDIGLMYQTVLPTAGASCAPASPSETIACYLKQSLSRDKISFESVSVSVKNVEKWGEYLVEIKSSDPRAALYQTVQPQWLDTSHAYQALQGVQDCQKDTTNCWKPNPDVTSKNCPGPWAFYLPLGLPMVSQKLVLLLHYPPYTSMQQFDYLNNATLNRWQRLLTSVGVPSGDVTLYEPIVDIIPIAAPGSNEAPCLTTTMASTYFNSQANGYYVTPMLKLLADPPTNPSKTSTRPVIVFGAEPRQLWQQLYKLPSFNVLQAGTTPLDVTSSKTTPYMAANHPIAAVYDTCTSTPSIQSMEIQDLTTACWASTMGANPDADPVGTEKTCNSQFTNPSPANKALICINAMIDMSYKPSLTWDQATALCNQNNQNPCPVPGK